MKCAARAVLNLDAQEVGGILVFRKIIVVPDNLGAVTLVCNAQGLNFLENLVGVVVPLKLLYEVSL